MINDQLQAPQLSPDFHRAGTVRAPSARRKRLPPFSLRLNEDERKELEGKADGQPLGAYIRGQLLGAKAVSRKRTGRPGVDHQKIALVLAALGQSRLSQNINQLAKAANMGTLDVSLETDQALQTACAEIIALRQILIEALGLKVED